MEKKKTKIIEIRPAEGKCWQNKRGHKFIHTNGKTGLPLYIEDTEEARVNFNKQYIQVDIK